MFLFCVSITICLSISFAYLIFMVLTYEKIAYYKTFKEGTCLSNDCFMALGSKCEGSGNSKSCRTTYKLYCNYTVITPQQYKNYSEVIYVLYKYNSYDLEKNIIAYTDIITKCYIKPPLTLKAKIPSVSEMHHSVVAFSICYPIIFVIFYIIAYKDYKNDKKQEEINVK